MMAIVTVGMVLVAALVVGVLVLLYAPSVDERLGFFTKRDLRRFLSHDVEGTTVVAKEGFAFKGLV